MIENLTSMSDDRLEIVLQHLGFNEKQARLYKALFKVESARAARLATLTGIPRSNVYVLVEDLIAKGLVEVLGKGKVKAFRAAEPGKLLDLLSSHEKALESARQMAEDLVPRLNQEWKHAIGKPLVRHLSGAEGLKEVFEDIYGSKTNPVYGAIDVEKIEGFMDGMSEGELVPSRKKSNLGVKVIFNDTPLARKLHEKDKEDNRESILFDLEKYPVPAELESYEDKVAMMSFKQGDFVGIIVQNEEFAITLNSIIRYLFDHIRACPTPQAGVEGSEQQDSH